MISVPTWCLHVHPNIRVRAPPKEPAQPSCALICLLDLPIFSKTEWVQTNSASIATVCIRSFLQIFTEVLIVVVLIPESAEFGNKKPRSTLALEIENQELSGNVSHKPECPAEVRLQLHHIRGAPLNVDRKEALSDHHRGSKSHTRSIPTLVNRILDNLWEKSTTTQQEQGYVTSNDTFEGEQTHQGDQVEFNVKCNQSSPHCFISL